MDPQTRAFLEQLKAQIAELSGVKGAVEQIERTLAGMPTQIDKKLDLIRRTAWDDRGRYRGVFGSGDAGEQNARCFGLFVLSVTGNTKATEALRGEMKSIYERAMGDTTASGDGLAPIEYSKRVQRLVEEFGVFAANAFPQPMQSGQLTFQRREGGVTVYKVGQNVAATASELGYKTLNLNADKWAALVLYPNELGDDAATLGELVALEIAQGFAEQTDLCGFIGNGEPAHLDVVGITTRLGQLNGVDDGGGLVLASGNAWSEIVEADILKLIGQPKHIRGAKNKFYASNPFIWQVLHRIALGKGGVTLAEYEGERRLMCLGFPIEIVQSMPQTAANSSICCLFGDVKLSSTHGKTKDLNIIVDRSVKVIEQQTVVLGIQRHAISNHSLGDANTAGPVVGLITAAG